MAKPRHPPARPGATAEAITDEVQYLRAVVETLRTAVARCSRDSRYVWVSQPYAEWIGKSVEDTIGRPIAEVIGLDAFAALRPHIERVLQGEPVEYEDRIPFRGTLLRWVRVTLSPILDETGSSAGWVSVIADIDDERRQAEEILRGSESSLPRLAAIVESSDDAIISKDLHGIVTSWNRAAERMLGYKAEDIVGRSIRLIIPQDRQQEEDVVLDRIKRGEATEHFETVRRRKDGSLIPISLTVSPVRNFEGKVIGASKIARDISERKRAEALTARANRQAFFLSKLSAALTRSRRIEHTLETLADLAVPAIATWCVVDVLTEEGTLSRAAVTQADSTRAKLSALLKSLDAIAASPAGAAYVIRHGLAVVRPHLPEEEVADGAAGAADSAALLQALGIESYLCVPMIAHDQVLGALTLATTDPDQRYAESDLRFAQDIASRAAMAIENARAYQQLERANGLKDEFLATLSHELRTPLNAVLGYSRMLRSGATTGERAAQAMEVVERNATLLTQIVEDVLDVSRIVAGKTRLQVQSVRLARVVNEAVETVAPAADAKGVRIQVLLDHRDGTVSGDPDRLQQIIWNLLANAVKFTPRGGLVVVRLEQAESQMEIIVSDTGIGIPAEFLPRVFDRFRQAEGGTKWRHGGLGLGLAIARHLVEMHGGTIHAASEGEGMGSTFRVVLPLMLAHPEVRLEGDLTHPAVTSRPAAAVPTADLSGIHVLAVDDHDDALGLLQEILETAGARVTKAASARDVLDQIERINPNVLIADLGMPEMDGFELIERIRHHANSAIRDLPAAALTAYARSEDRTKALRSGFGMHLAKPIDPAELVAAVTTLARTSRR